MLRSDCSFCDIVAGARPAHVVWADDEHVAFLDRNPVAEGHALLVPRAHVATIYDLPPEAYSRLFARVRDLAGPIVQASGAPRTAIAIEGFGVEHAHVHLVPVWKGGELDPCRQAPATDEALRIAAVKLQAAIAAASDFGGAG